MLRLPTIRAQFEDMAEVAEREQMSYRGFLAELLMAECDDRARRRSERRIKAAGFPRDKSLRAFDFDANPHIDAATIHTLAKCEWIRKGLPLCLIGDCSRCSPNGRRRTPWRSPATTARLLDKDLHRPAALRRDRRPAHLRRQHHRNRHRLLSTCPHQSRPRRDDDQPGRPSETLTRRGKR